MSILTVETMRRDYYRVIIVFFLFFFIANMIDVTSGQESRPPCQDFTVQLCAF